MAKTRGKKLYDQRIATACSGKKHPRVCPKCGLKKRITEFNRCNAGPEGRNRYCGKCAFAYSKAYRTKRRSDPRWRGLGLLSWARSRAKKSGTSFTLTEEWLMPRLEAGKCEATGLPFKFDGPRSQTGRVSNVERAFGPSLDRIDPKGDYSPGNSRVVVAIYNVMRNDWREEDFRAVVNTLQARWASETP